MGGVNQFYMYDDSSLTMYDGSIADLYLYDNTTASCYGGSSSMDWYIDPANTGWVKMYGTLDSFSPYGHTVKAISTATGYPMETHLISTLPATARIRISNLSRSQRPLRFLLSAVWLFSKKIDDN